MREMILAKDEEGRRKALEKLLPLQKKDFAGIFLLDRPESDHLTQFNGYRTCR